MKLDTDFNYPSKPGIKTRREPLSIQLSMKYQIPANEMWTMKLKI